MKVWAKEKFFLPELGVCVDNGTKLSKKTIFCGQMHDETGDVLHPLNKKGQLAPHGTQRGLRYITERTSLPDILDLHEQVSVEEIARRQYRLYAPSIIMLPRSRSKFTEEYFGKQHRQAIRIWRDSPEQATKILKKRDHEYQLAENHNHQRRMTCLNSYPNWELAHLSKVKDPSMNTFLALELTSVKENIDQFPNFETFFDEMTKKGINVNPYFLREGLITLTSNKTIATMLSSGIISEENLDELYSHVSDWLTQTSEYLYQTRKTQSLLPTYPTHLDFKPEDMPHLDFLPYIACMAIKRAIKLPETILDGDIYPPEMILSDFKTVYLLCADTINHFLGIKTKKDDRYSFEALYKNAAKKIPLRPDHATFMHDVDTLITTICSYYAKHPGLLVRTKGRPVIHLETELPSLRKMAEKITQHGGKETKSLRIRVAKMLLD